MAEKEKKSKIVLERVYNIPLRKEFQKAPNWKRTPRAVSAVRDFLVKHMKSGNINIGKYLNLELWKHGIKNPPHHIKVECKKDSDGIVFAELVGAPAEKKEEKQKTKAKKAEEKESHITETEQKEKEFEEKLEELKEQKEEKAKEIEKEEIKEIQEEHPKTHRPPKEEDVSKELHLRKKEMIPGR